MGHVTQVFQDKGFLAHLYDWILSFLTGQQALLKLGNRISDLFTILNGTP